MKTYGAKNVTNQILGLSILYLLPKFTQLMCPLHYLNLEDYFSSTNTWGELKNMLLIMKFPLQSDPWISLLYSCSICINPWWFICSRMLLKNWKTSIFICYTLTQTTLLIISHRSGTQCVKYSSRLHWLKQSYLLTY